MLSGQPSAARNASTPGVFVGPVISTLGLGLEAGVRLNEFVGIRGGGNWFGLDFDREIDDVDYDIDATIGSIGALVDLHPFGGGFRLSGGLRLNFTNADLTGRPTTDIEIGDDVFAADEVGTLEGEADVDRVAPYLGIGYAGTLAPGLSLGFDLGVMYQGSPDVELDSVGGVLSDDAALEAALADEEEDIEDDLEDFKFYPVIGLALLYRF
jgi:hypothetical protein